MEAEEVAAIVLQAHIRGFLVRRKLQRVRQEYLEVVREIEGEEAVLYPEKWILSIPQFTTLDRIQVTRPHKPECNGYSHSELSQSARQCIQFQHRETPYNVTSRGKGTPDSSRVVGERDAAVLEASNTETDTPVREISNSETDSLIRETNQTETDAPIREISHTETDPPVRETSHTETDPPVRETSHTETDAPVQEASHTETDAPVQEASHTETDAPVQEASHTDNSMILKSCLSKEVPARTIGPGLEDTLHLSGISVGTFQGLELRRDHSLFCEEKINLELSMKTASELRKYRSHLAMEILWVQQAIASRKNYLMVRQRLGACD